ncbi:MAG: NFACT family protein [Abditibacteriota bacterium]|nr:NFACT family protein [Abditibacteriota bacterium]
MTYDSLVLRHTIKELSPCILGALVQKARQSESSEALLEMRSRGEDLRLLLSWNATFARMYLTASGIKAAPKAPDFCMILRKYLTGSILTEVRQIGLERIVRLSFDSGGAVYQLWLEIMGRHSNLTLTDSEGLILGVAKPVGRKVSAVRQLLIGMTYTLPPNTERRDPFRTDPETFAGLIRDIGAEECSPAFIKAFTGLFEGFSPQLAAEVWLGLTPGDTEQAYERIRSLEELPAGCWLQTEPDGKAAGAYPLYLRSLPEASQKPRDSINETLDTAYRSLISRHLRETARKELLVRTDKSIAFNEGLIKSCRETLAKLPMADRYRELGDLLFGSLHAVKKGDPFCEVTDYYDPELKTVRIDLDTRLAPAENAERYYKRAKRVKAAAEQAEERIPPAEERLRQLREAREQTLAEDRLQGLRDIKNRLQEAGLLKEIKAAEEEGSGFDGYRIRRTWSPEGWEILYGESADANDYLTTRLARPNDIWFHGRQITGSHVIIRTTAKTCNQVPYGSILYAAGIAAANSQAKHSSLVPVDYTFRKYVRKPKGSPPGFVIYRNEKTIDVKNKRLQ